MKIFNSLEELVHIVNPVITIGSFDGVHLGHQKILKKLREEADKINGETVLFTFKVHPKMILFPDSHGIKLIQDQKEKKEKLSEYQLDNLILFPFTKEFSTLSAYQFIKDILVDKIGIKKIVIGYDHQFGNNREGNIDFLKSVSDEFGFEVIEISAEEINEVNISSTKIRQAILSGDIKTANAYLNDTYGLEGTVVKGQQLGRKVGFPTANIKVEFKDKLIPGNGVYFVKVAVEKKSYYGMLNIGVRPTIDVDLARTIEVNIFDFNHEIYNHEIKIDFISKIRDEQKFESLDKLIQQLNEDENYCRSAISVRI
jgi:riboflavin kinase/FMN adenylyltransferase